MEYRFLNRIQSPSDLRELDESDIPALASEIRAFLIESVEQTGGHLASNLGVVELTLALHRTFDFSHDRLIFDVGHQCYIHKLLTGRRDQFSTLRTVDGLSGFPKMNESIYDAFGTGHSSTSLSAALGFSEAFSIQNSDAYTVVVLGDGAFTGGMIHEALNNCKKDRKLILILNENEMSISRNIGRFAEHIAHIRSSERYYRTKNKTVSAISHIPLIGQPLFRAIRFVKQTLKNQMYGSNLFEELGFYYLGPIDGNDYSRVRLLLKEAVAYGKSVVIHVHTQKGKGYLPAETAATLFHSVPPKSHVKTDISDTFSGHLGVALCSLAEVCPSLCAITAAMEDATGLKPFRDANPERFFDVGIAEEHALTFCAGLSAAGMKPVFAVYSSFLQRGYDNLIHDIALQNLPVIICIDRAGLSQGDGPTHHGIFDVAFLSEIPNFTIYAPATFASMEQALKESMPGKGPCAIRYHNGGELIGTESSFYPAVRPLAPRADFPKEASVKQVIVTYGRLVSEAKKAQEALGQTCGVIVMEKLTPYTQTAKDICELLPTGVETVLLAEEGIRCGGAGMCLLHALLEQELLPNAQIRVLAIDEPFQPQKGKNNLYAAYGIDSESMVNALLQKQAIF